MLLITVLQKNDFYNVSLGNDFYYTRVRSGQVRWDGVTLQSRESKRIHVVTLILNESQVVLLKGFYAHFQFDLAYLKCMQVCANRYKGMQVYASVCKCMQVYASVCKCMQVCANRHKCMQVYTNRHNVCKCIQIDTMYASVCKGTLAQGFLHISLVRNLAIDIINVFSVSQKTGVQKMFR